jgi:hypothetical protein
MLLTVAAAVLGATLGLSLESRTRALLLACAFAASGHFVLAFFGEAWAVGQGHATGVRIGLALSGAQMGQLWASIGAAGFAAVAAGSLTRRRGHAGLWFPGDRWPEAPDARKARRQRRAR